MLMCLLSVLCAGMQQSCSTLRNFLGFHETRATFALFARPWETRATFTVLYKYL